MRTRSTARLAAILLTLLSILCLLGCRQASPPRYFSYLDTPAQATLTGKINGVAFAATLYSQGRGGSTAQSIPSLSLTFTAPESLAGMTMQYRAETKEWSLSLDDLSGKTDAAGLGMVAAILLCEQPIQATKQVQNSIVLTLLDGTELMLDKATGIPLRATVAKEGRAIEIVVVTWEKEKI